VKTEEAIKNEQSKDTGNIGHTRHRANRHKPSIQHSTTQTVKRMHNRITNENSPDKMWVRLQVVLKKQERMLNLILKY
jgi:hypothetical protein